MNQMTMKRNLLNLSIALSVLTTPLFGQRVETSIKNYLNEYQEDLGLSDTDLKNWYISDQRTDSDRGITYVYITQEVNNLPVYNAMGTFAIVKDRVLLTGNKLIKNIDKKINTEKPGFEAEASIQAACNFLAIDNSDVPELIHKKGDEYLFEKGEISQEDIPVRLMYVPVNEELRLAWDLSIYTMDSQHWWSIRIDAVTGNELNRVDWVLNCEFGLESDHTSHRHGQTVKPEAEEKLVTVMMPPPPGTDQYNVFALPVESPNHGGRSLVVGPYDPVASPYGWHDDDGNPGADFTWTQGNNVRATEDMNDNNGVGYMPDGGASLDFDFPLNMAQNPNNYLDPAITNLFYMNNMMHDVWYHYGFDEQGGNFQENNYGNGGAASDYVYAEAQDGGGMNNANFSTPPDGNNPRMQMYLWSSSGADYLTVNSPAPLSGPYASTAAQFGPPIPTTPITEDIVIFDDNVPDEYDACEAAVNAAAQNGKIVLIRRGTCEFGCKVESAQNNGALAVIIVNNVPGLINMGGGVCGGNVTIPSLMISQADGAAIIAEIEGGGTVNATIVDPGVFDQDGDFDNGIIAHEYGHGISNRLTGGPSNTNCLSNAEQMGEGWSDWFSLMMTIEPGDLSTDNRGIGTFVTGEPTTGVGIRPAPYNTNFAVNGWTYDGTNNTGAISQPHGIGFIWCTMLWDMTWAFIDEYGFDPDLYTGTGGNNIAMELVMQGMALQTCNPGFEDGRDAILQADQILYGGIHQCLIWNAFAARGLGFSADQGSVNSRTDQVEAFDLPPGMVNVTGTENATACGSYTWAANGQTYTSTGSYQTVLLSSTGCDSTVTLNLTISGNSTGNETAADCDSYTWAANSQTYTNSGTYTTTLVNAAGCDSIVTLDLTINNSTSETQTVGACGSYLWPVNSQTYTSSGTYTEILTSTAGCDSVITLNLTMSSTASTSQSATACSSYTWGTTGQTYTTSGTYDTTLMASSGCDSIVTLYLTINQPTAGSESVSECVTYTWPANGQTYTSSGFYSTTLVNAAGCDSTATLNLVILQPSASTETVASCDNYTWSANGQTYTSSGTYTETLTNAAGCDSVVTLDLTINNSVSSTETVTSCGQYVWPANSQTYTSTGIYSTTLTSAEGCDSIITLNLTIENVSSTSVSYVDAVTLFADLNFASYQWVDCDNNYAPTGDTNQMFQAAVNGNYAVIITENGCSDTSACFPITELGLEDSHMYAGIELYPNPTDGEVFINLADINDEVSIRLINMLGQLVDERTYSGTDSVVYSLNEAPGVYVIEVNTSDGASVRVRLVKQ